MDPDLFLNMGSAPASSRHCTAAAHRVRTARCKGAAPFLSCALTSAPAFSRQRMVFHLSLRVPNRAVDVAVGCIVQRAASTVVHYCVWIGPGRQQQPSDFNPVAGGSQMQRGVANVSPVKDLGLVKPGFIDTARCEVAIRPEQFLHFGAIVLVYRGQDRVHRGSHLVRIGIAVNSHVLLNRTRNTIAIVWFLARLRNRETVRFSGRFRKRMASKTAGRPGDEAADKKSPAGPDGRPGA